MSFKNNLTMFFIKYFNLQCLVKRGQSFYIHLETVGEWESVQEASETKIMSKERNIF